MVLSHPASGLSPLTSFGKKEEKTRFSKREKPPTSTYRDKRTHSLSRRQAGAVISRQCLV